jgi:MFS family permease
MTAIGAGGVAQAGTDDAVFRKVFRRLTWFLFVLLVASFLDRINIGFAALTMNADLGLSAAAYGAAITVFYVGYVLFEIPSNLILARIGARIWIARIMITGALPRQQRCWPSARGACTASARWSAPPRPASIPASSST